MVTFEEYLLVMPANCRLWLQTDLVIDLMSLVMTSDRQFEFLNLHAFRRLNSFIISTLDQTPIATIVNLVTSRFKLLHQWPRLPRTKGLPMPPLAQNAFTQSTVAQSLPRRHSCLPPNSFRYAVLFKYGNKWWTLLLYKYGQRSRSQSEYYYVFLLALDCVEP